MSILVYGVMARTAVLLVTGGIMALASLASPLVLHWTGKRAQRTKQAQRRERYRAVLAALNEEVARAKAAAGGPRRRRPPRTRRARGLARRPAPVGAPAGRRGRPRRRHRRRGRPTGFTVRRHGTPSVDADQDEELLAEVAAAEASAASLPGAPLVLRLADAGVVAVTGDRAGSLALVRAALLELVLTCAPDDLCLVAAFPPAEVDTWAWVKSLPHTAPPSPPAGCGRENERLVATRAEELERHLDAVVGPRLRLLDERTWAASRQAFPRAVVLVDRYDPLTELGLAGTLTTTLGRAARWA